MYDENAPNFTKVFAILVDGGDALPEQLQDTALPLLHTNVHRLLLVRMRHTQHIKLWERLAAVAQRHHGTHAAGVPSDDARNAALATATAWNNLGVLRWKQARVHGKFCEDIHAQSLRLVQDALELRRTWLGGDHPTVAVTLAHKAGMLQSLGRLEEATALYTSAQDIQRRHDDPAALARTLNYQGRILRLQGNTDAALAVYKEALALRRDALGSDHPDTATTHHNVGDTLRDAGDHGAAVEAYATAYNIKKRTLGAWHPKCGQNLTDWACAEHARGDRPHARQLFREALGVLSTALGDAHPLTKQCRDAMEGCALATV